MTLRLIGGTSFQNTKNKEGIKILWCSLIFCCLPFGLLAQQVVKGQVVDDEGAALPYASIVVKPGLNERSNLAYTLTDDNGNFEFSIDSIDTIILITQTLGQRTDTTVVNLPILDEIIIQLKPSNTELPTVTISDQRLPVVEREDTTTFRAADFRDTTDRKVEELLRKLPGVEVKGDGAISVNGKPLHRLLIEGSDLFGADYQLGSKNINARDIGTVEVIDHFEDNAVLKSVSNSEAIVLNLKLEDDVRSVVAGNFILGGGYGGEAKYSEYASLYRIDRNHKTIFIGNADNVGNDVGIGSFDNNYAADKSGEIAEPLLSPLDLTNNPQLEQAGLRREYTDNGKRFVGTLRHESNLAKRWTVKVNLLGKAYDLSQQVRDKQEFIGDQATYAINNLRNWNTQQRTTEGELNLDYFSTSQKFSFELYGSNQYNTLDIDELVSTDSRRLQRTALDSFSNITLRGLGSYEIRPGLVTQLEFSHGSSNQLYRGRFAQPTIANVIGQDTPFLANFSADRSTTIVSSKLLWKTGAWLLQGQLDAGSYLFQLSRLTTNYWSPTIGTSLSYGASTLRINGSLRYDYFHTETELPASTYRLSAAYETKWSAGRQLRMSLATYRQYPELRYFANEFVFPIDLFQLTQPGPMPERSSNVLATLYYSIRNNLKLTDWSLNLFVKYSDNIPNPNTDFLEDVVLSSWSYGGKRRSVSASTRYSFFVLPLKSDVALRLSTSSQQLDFTIEGQAATFQYWSSSAKLEAGLLLLKRLRIKGSSNFTHNQLLNENQYYSTWRNDGELIFSLTDWRVVGGLSHAYNSQIGNVSNFTASYLGAEYHLKWRDQEITIRSRVYNLTNREAFTSQSVYGLYLYENRVPTVGRYFLFTVDFGL